MGLMRLFISCVTREFGSYRADLRDLLTSAECEVRIQDDFDNGPGTLLEKLNGYIAECDAVIHLIGDGAGVRAKPAEVRWLRGKYTDFPSALPELKKLLKPNSCPFTYTQWECYLALYHCVPCYVYLADGGSRREAEWAPSVDDAKSQQAHIERLRQGGKDRRQESFGDARNIADRFVRSYARDGGLTSARGAGRTTFPRYRKSTSAPHALADRQDEFRRFQWLISDQVDRRALLILGPSDLGKSVLLSAFAGVARRVSLIGVAHGEFKTGLGLNMVLAQMRRDLMALPFRRFDREAGAEGRPEMLHAAFLEDLSESRRPVLIVLDTFEQATEDSKRWVEDHLLPRCCQTQGLRLVIAGTQVPAPSPRFSSLTERLELGPIVDPGHWCSYFRKVLKCQRFPDEHLATLVLAAGGRPRTMHLFLTNLLNAPGQA